MEGLLRNIVYIDLVGLSENDAKKALIKGIKVERAKPEKAPAFPGEEHVRTILEKPGFPPVNSLSKLSSVSSGGSAYWLFQFVPKTHTGKWVERSKKGEPILWRISRYRDKIRANDFVYLWRAGKDGGLLGWGRIESDEFVNYKNPDKPGETEPRLPVVFQTMFKIPITRDVVKKALEGMDFPFFKNSRGTNFSVEPKIAIALNRLITKYSYESPPDPVIEPDDYSIDDISDDTLSDEAIFLTDTPAVSDTLGRQYFAIALARWLNRLWFDLNKEKDGYGNSFITHLYGEWGSGKSTLINLLESALKNIKQFNAPDNQKKLKCKQGWITVNFNAWRNQHMKPEWWPLMDQVFRQSVKGFGFIKRVCKKIKERWRRLLGGYGIPIFAIFLVILLGLIALLIQPFKNYRGVIETVTKALTFITVLSSAIIVAIRSLFTGSASSASMFQNFAADPMETIRKHYRTFVGELGCPIMVFIDDLDRCRKEYVVRLLESLQTLFNDSRIFYVVAADRRWISACFEATYEDLGKSVAELGRPTGYLFLEKLFQLAIGVPRVHPELAKSYLQHLLKNTSDENIETSKSREKAFHNAVQTAVSEFSGINNESELYEMLKDDTNDPLKDQARVAAAILHSSSESMDRSREHRLRRFGSLIEPNPRAIKLLITAYGVYVASIMASGVRILDDELLDQVALWTILSLRFPRVAEYLEHHPQHLNEFTQENCPKFVPEDIWDLVHLPQIQRVIHGKDIESAETGDLINQPLNSDFLEVLVGKKSWQDFIKNQESNAS